MKRRQSKYEQVSYFNNPHAPKVKPRRLRWKIVKEEEIRSHDPYEDFDFDSFVRMMNPQ